MRTRLVSIFLLACCLMWSACSTAPEKPPGEQYFADAKSNIASLDFDTALRNLDRMIKAAGDTPLGDQGRVLRAALLTALADGSHQMAAAYTTGRDQAPARGRQADFTRMRSDYFGIARSRIINAMEAVMQQRAKLGDQPLTLAMDFPSFSGTEHPALAKIKSGLWVTDDERYRAELETVRNSLAHILAGFVGAGDDLHKGHDVFDKGPAQIDPRLYLLELSRRWMALSDMFDRKALDDARYKRVCCEVARDNIEIVLKLLVTKPDKELEQQAKKIKADCEKTLKSLPS